VWVDGSAGPVLQHGWRCRLGFRVAVEHDQPAPDGGAGWRVLHQVARTGGADAVGDALAGGIED